MLMFLYNIGMTIRKAGRFTTTEGVLLAGLGAAPRCCTCRRCFEFDNYTVAIFYRWWTIHLWVEGVWEMIQGGFLAYLLIRLSGADREVMEKWLYVIVGLVFIAGILGTAHHYYWVGVPALLAADRRLLQRARAARAGRHGDLRLLRRCAARASRIRTRWRCTGRIGSAVFTVFGAGLLGPRAHLAGGQQVDARHADHGDARPRGVLRRLRDDRAGDDHLRAAGAHWTQPRTRARPQHRATGRSGCRSAACSA